MSDEIKNTIMKLVEKVKDTDNGERALQLSHAILYLTQALHNVEKK